MHFDHDKVAYLDPASRVGRVGGGGVTEFIGGV